MIPFRFNSTDHRGALRAIRALCDLASPDDVRSVLRGVHIRAADGVLTMTANNTYAAARLTWDFWPAEGVVNKTDEWECVVDARVLKRHIKPSRTTFGADHKNGPQVADDGVIIQLETLPGKYPTNAIDSIIKRLPDRAQRGNKIHPFAFNLDVLAKFNALQKALSAQGKGYAPAIMTSGKDSNAAVRIDFTGWGPYDGLPSDVVGVLMPVRSLAL